MGFSRQEYWSRLPRPPPGDLPNPEIEPVSPESPALQADSLPPSHREISYFICTFLLQFRSVAQPCPTLCDPMDCSTPGLPVHRHLLEFTQTHVHHVREAIQPSHSLSSPSPPAFNLSQRQGLSSESFPRIRWPSIGVSASASVLPMNIQD